MRESPFKIYDNRKRRPRWRSRVTALMYVPRAEPEHSRLTATLARWKVPSLVGGTALLMALLSFLTKHG